MSSWFMWSKKFKRFGVHLGVIGAWVLSACAPTNGPQVAQSFLDRSSYSNKEVLRISLGNHDPFTPFAFGNPNFNNGSLDSSVLDNAILKLFRYKSHGDWSFDANNNVVTKPVTDLFLEAATGFKVYQNDRNSAGSVSIDFAVNDKNQGYISDDTRFSEVGKTYSDIKRALSSAYSVEFKINKNIKWFDAETKQAVAQLSPRDFVAGLKLFQLSAQLRVQGNGYLLSTLGIDVAKTLNDRANNSTTGDRFTLYLDTNNINTFLFDRYTFNFFAPAPSSNPEVQQLLRIDSKNNDDLIVVKDGVVDYTASRFDDVYGWGLRQKYGAKGWYAGPYLLDSTSFQDIVLTANRDYFLQVYGAGDWDEKIKRIVAYYGNSFATTEAAYQGFITNEIDYVLLDDNTKTDAFMRYVDKPDVLSVIGQGQLASAGDFWWNTDIWDENYKLKPTIDPSYERFVINFWNPDAVLVRKGINSLINYPKLAANIQYFPGNYDVRFSNVPFGNLAFKNANTNQDMDVYEAYYKGEQFVVTNPYNNQTEVVDYTGVFGKKFNYFLDDINNGTNKNSYLIKTSPTFDTDQKAFRAALSNLGYSKSHPMHLSILFRENPVTEKTNQLFLNWSEAIKELSDGAILFKPLTAYTRDVIAVFRDNGFEMAYNGWGLDFRDASNYSTRSIGYFITNKTGTAKLRASTNVNDRVQMGLRNFMSIPQLWPRLYERISQQVVNGIDLNATTQDANWEASLFRFLVSNNAFAQKVNKQTNQANSLVFPSDYRFTDAYGDKLADLISSWMVQDRYNSYVLNKWIDDFQTLIPLPFHGYYSRTWRLSRPYLKPVNPVYKGLKFADWSVDLTK